MKHGTEKQSWDWLMILAVGMLIGATVGIFYRWIWDHLVAFWTWGT